jgi:hypothetical protein
MVGDDQAVGRDERCRASSEADHGVHWIIGQIAQSIRVDLEAGSGE